MRERDWSFVTEQKFELAKLHGLKTGRRLQPVAKTGERRPCHWLQDVDLTNEGLHDRAGALEGMDRAEQIARAEVAFHLLELGQEVFEPELVGLVDNDEQHFIVLGRTGARIL